jgi:hypothetical protein
MSSLICVCQTNSYGNGQAVSNTWQPPCIACSSRELCKARVPPSCKFFWLALLGRCWTSDQFQHHNLQNSSHCALCSQADEIIHHMVLGCVFAREAWFGLLRRMRLQYLTPTANNSIVDWWCATRKQIPKLTIIAWLVWKELNSCVFNNTSTPPRRLMQLILDEGLAWVATRFTALSPFVA